MSETILITSGRSAALGKGESIREGERKREKGREREKKQWGRRRRERERKRRARGGREDSVGGSAVEYAVIWGKVRALGVPTRALWAKMCFRTWWKHNKIKVSVSMTFRVRVQFRDILVFVWCVRLCVCARARESGGQLSAFHALQTTNMLEICVYHDRMWFGNCPRLESERGL